MNKEISRIKSDDSFLKLKDQHIQINRPSWDDYFMDMCKHISKRSLDQDTKVGCIIVDVRHRVIASGYNSFPTGVNDEAWPNNRKEKHKILKHKRENSFIFISNYDSSDEYMASEYIVIGEVTKYDIIAHAEENAIASHQGSLEGGTMYCNYLPCNVCARLIITAGIKKLVYQIENIRYIKSCAIARQLFSEAKVELVKYKKSEDIQDEKEE